MTQKQALKAMKKRYPGLAIFADRSLRFYTHSNTTCTEYSVYAGDAQKAHAGGKGDNWQEALDNCKEYQEVKRC